MSVCMSVCLSASLPQERMIRLHQISVHVTYIAVARSSFGSVADTLYTSGFVDDVTFAHNGQEQATRKGRILKLTQEGSCCGYRVKPQHLASPRWHDWSVSTGGSRLLVTLNDGEGVRLLLAA